VKQSARSAPWQSSQPLEMLTEKELIWYILLYKSPHKKQMMFLVSKVFFPCLVYLGSKLLTSWPDTL